MAVSPKDVASEMILDVARRAGWTGQQTVVSGVAALWVYVKTGSEVAAVLANVAVATGQSVLKTLAVWWMQL